MNFHSASGLDALGIREILDADSRPTFIIDLNPERNLYARAKGIRPVFCNAALCLHERLLDTILRDNSYEELDHQEKQVYQAFINWATSVTTHDDSRDVFPLTFHFAELLWTGSTVRKRWRLISGNSSWRAVGPLRDLSLKYPLEAPTSLPQPRNFQETLESLPQPELTQSEAVTFTEATTLVSSIKPRSNKSVFYQGRSRKSSVPARAPTRIHSIALAAPKGAVADWTVPNPKGFLSSHLEFARTIDWANTPLGPMEDWSPEFRQAANLCMGNPHPAALFWGTELTMLYNEAYAAEIAGIKHPSLMGTGFFGPFSELWEYTGPIFAECARTGISVRKENDHLPIDRHGILEETFFSWSFTPLYGGTDRILGFYNAPFETTQQVLSQRRMQTIRAVGDCTARAKTVKDFWGLVLDGLQDYHFDVPFALLYSVVEGEGGDHLSTSAASESAIGQKTCRLEGAIGVPEGHAAAPPLLSLAQSLEGFVPSFREAMRTREPTLLHAKDGTLAEGLLEGMKRRGFGGPCREAIIFPVRPTTGDAVLAFLVLGANPRRPYDDGYKAFTNMLNRQLATSLASTILFEEEIRRSRDLVEAAALEKERLAQQLDLQANRLQRMTEFSPLGMFLISLEGVLREANERFYGMTGHTRDSQSGMSWMDFIEETSMNTMEGGWHRLANQHSPWSGELQLKKRSTRPVNLEGESIDYWVLFIAHPEFASDGSLRSIMGSIMDISYMKWAQGLQSRQLQEAQETRRQQNEFIDITSHEMRNPLSAILQCADDISSALSDSGGDGTLLSEEILDSCVDAAHTIALCAQHQKTIVDDILTISKLDSNLLLINPVITQPEAIVKRALKMFESEFQAKNIEIAFQLHPLYSELRVNWVAIDPSRVLQILINLMTNAIKFTASSNERRITVALGASLTPPGESEVQIPGFQYVPSNTINANVTNPEEWGTGDILYMHFKVQDTGCGLTKEEELLLFQRFKQASPRTHAQYGGSGLGLFISKRLAELQGGQIGVTAERGRGSVFGFYVQTRRASPPSGGTSPHPMSIEHQPSDQVLVNPTVESPSHDTYGVTRSVAHPKLGNVRGRARSGAGLDVLVVEDNQINQKVLVKQLKNAGCRVSAASDGIEALAFLERTNFRKEDGLKLTVILMDLEMPNMDGLTCVRRIRQMEEIGRMKGHVPIIAVTANVREEQIVTAKKSGMDDVVSKPFRIPELLEKVKGLMAAQDREVLV
ncbi:MAG: hypothetical protein Q9227_004945 [Pyrenula ochraceoflavens]